MPYDPEVRIVAATEAEGEGFAMFNGGDHLLVEVPDGPFTISARTSEGKKITFAFCPFEKGGPAQTVDVQHHTATMGRPPGSSEDRPLQRVIGFTTGRDTFRAEETDSPPTTLLTVQLQSKAQADAETARMRAKMASRKK